MRAVYRIRGAARRLIRQPTPSEAGFTLIELIVVIAILGILIAIAVPTVRGFLESSKEQAYESDQRVIQLAVEAYYYSPRNQRFDNRRQYPIVGKHKATTQTAWKIQKCEGTGSELPVTFDDDPNEEFKPSQHPIGGTRGGSPMWQEGDDAARDQIRNQPNSEELYCPPDSEEAPDRASIPGREHDPDEEHDRADHWLLDAATQQDGASCLKDWATRDIGDPCLFFDSRDYFIDFCELVLRGFIEEIPRSASADHDHECIGVSDSGDTDESPTDDGETPTPTTIPDDRGSYTWYVDSNGRVQSLYYFYPTTDRTGYQDVYP